MRATGSGITFYEYIESCDSLLVNTGTNCCLIPCDQNTVRADLLVVMCMKGGVRGGRSREMYGGRGGELFELSFVLIGEGFVVFR